MTGFDIAVLLIVGLGAITGFARGFVQEIMSLGAWVLAILAIRMFHGALSLQLEGVVGSQSAAAILAFALLLVLPVGAVKLAARWAGNMSRGSVLGPIDRVLGLGFGSVKAILIVVLGYSVVVLAYDTIWGVDGRPEWMTGARTYRFVDASSEAMVRMIAERRREMRAEASAE